MQENIQEIKMWQDVQTQTEATFPSLPVYSITAISAREIKTQIYYSEFSVTYVITTRWLNKRKHFSQLYCSCSYTYLLVIKNCTYFKDMSSK